MTAKEIEFESERFLHKLYGENPENLRLVEDVLNVSLLARGGSLRMEGDADSLGHCEEFFELLRTGREQGFTSCNGDFAKILGNIATSSVSKSSTIWTHFRWKRISSGRAMDFF